MMSLIDIPIYITQWEVNDTVVNINYDQRNNVFYTDLTIDNDSQPDICYIALVQNQTLKGLENNLKKYFKVL